MPHREAPQRQLARSAACANHLSNLTNACGYTSGLITDSLSGRQWKSFSQADSSVARVRAAEMTLALARLGLAV
jgi:hypothetical protein